MPVGTKIKQLREHKGWSQEDLAKRLNPPFTPQAIGKWEKGKSSPKMPTVAQLSKLFDVTISELLDDIVADEVVAAYLPLVSTAHMGDFDSLDADRMVEVPRTIATRHPRARVVHGIGSCMNRQLPEDAVLVIDPTMTPRNGNIVVAERDNQYIVRTFFRGNNTLILSADSYSDTYEDIVVNPDDDPVSILGVVVWYQAYADVHYA